MAASPEKPKPSRKHGAISSLFGGEFAKHRKKELSSIGIPQGTPEKSAEIDLEQRKLDKRMSKAILWADYDSILTLLKNGANPDAVDSWGNSALHAAAAKRADVVDALINHGANVNKSVSGTRNTPLMVAVMHDQQSIVDKLLAHGADPNLPDNFGISPLHNAARDGSVDLIHKLVQNGANPDAANDIGETPLHFAVRMHKRNAVNALLESGANPNAVEGSVGGTPLHCAAHYGNVGIVGALLSHGADPAIKTRKGKDTLALAKTPEIRKCIEDHIATLSAKNAAVSGKSGILKSISKFIRRGRAP